MRTNFITTFLLGLPLLSLVACSEESAPDGDLAPGEVRATIGPDGGELVGAAGTELEGVKLVVPAGALAEEAEVWLKPTFDGDALPDLSERVGVQVAVGSKATLGKPATLTLPFDGGAVARFGDTGDDVKVWIKGDDATWSLVEADATSSTDVTIALDHFTTAAAGVKVLGVTPTCGTSCDPSAEAHFDKGACGATAACLARIETTTRPETFDFAVSDKNVLGFLTASGGSVLAVGQNITDGTSNTSRALDLSTSARLGTAFSGTTFFAGLGSAGNAAFEGTTKPKVFDAGSGLGVVRTKNGATLRMFRSATGNLGAIDNASGKTLVLPPIPIPENANIASIGFAVSPLNPDGIMVIAVSHELIELVKDGDRLVESERIPLPSSLAQTGSLQLGASDTIMVIAVLVGGQVAVSRDLADFEIQDLAFPASSVAVGSDGTVVVGAAKTPELALIGADAAPVGVRLSDAAAGSPELSARIPRAIRRTQDGFVVMTQDRGFFTLGL